MPSVPRHGNGGDAMKSPHNWLEDLHRWTCESRSHRSGCLCVRCTEDEDIALTYQDIQAIQDEAFKAGVEKAVEVAQRCGAYLNVDSIITESQMPP